MTNEQHDVKPCIDEGEHLMTQRHARTECPMTEVTINIGTLETLKDAAGWRFDGARFAKGEMETLTEAIKIAETLIEGTIPRCDAPNPLQPALTCTLPETHDGMHSADSAMGHHEWRAK